MDIDIEKLTCGIQLTDIERNVLEYLLTHLDQALKLGVRGVARENFTSTSTVMRLSRKLGYNGFIEMRSVDLHVPKVYDSRRPDKAGQPVFFYP